MTYVAHWAEKFVCLRQKSRQNLSVLGALKNRKIFVNHKVSIVHFTVVCLVAKPLNRSEAKGDLVMIQTLLLLKCKLICYHAN